MKGHVKIGKMEQRSIILAPKHKSMKVFSGMESKVTIILNSELDSIA
jgi:hypothetical protein